MLLLIWYNTKVVVVCIVLTSASSTQGLFLKSVQTKSCRSSLRSPASSRAQLSPAHCTLALNLSLTKAVLGRFRSRPQGRSGSRGWKAGRNPHWGWMVEAASSKGIFLFNLKISGIILCRGRVWLKIWNQSGLLAKSSLQWTWLLEKSENSGAGGRWAA